MSETQPKEQPSRVVVPMTASDLIYMQLQDFKTEFRDSRKELNTRMVRHVKKNLKPKLKPCAKNSTTAWTNKTPKSISSPIKSMRFVTDPSPRRFTKNYALPRLYLSRWA